MTRNEKKIQDQQKEILVLRNKVALLEQMDAELRRLSGATAAAIMQKYEGDKDNYKLSISSDAVTDIYIEYDCGAYKDDAGNYVVIAVKKQDKPL